MEGFVSQSRLIVANHRNWRLASTAAKRSNTLLVKRFNERYNARIGIDIFLWR